MICRTCYFKDFCYAAHDKRTECDPFAKSCTEEYKFYLDRIDYLNKLKANAIGIELNRILAELDQLEDFAAYTCQDLAIGPIEKTNELPF